MAADPSQNPAQHRIDPRDSQPPQITANQALTSLGSRITKARERLGLSLPETARAAGVTSETMETLETGGDIELLDFIRIAISLGKSEWLSDLETLDPTPMERLNAIIAGNPLPMDAGSWHARQLLT